VLVLVLVLRESAPVYAGCAVLVQHDGARYIRWNTVQGRGLRRTSRLAMMRLHYLI